MGPQQVVARRGVYHSPIATNWLDSLRAEVQETSQSINGCVVTVNDSGVPVYNDAINKDRELPHPQGGEELVRAMVVIDLVHNLKYKPHNIVLEPRVRARVGRNSSDKFSDVAIYMQANGQTRMWAMIECKTPEDFEKYREKTWEQQLFNLAKFVESEPPKLLAHVSWKISEGLAGEIVDLVQAEEFGAWNANGQSFAATTIPKNYGRPVKQPLVRGGKCDLRVTAERNELDSLRNGLHNTLWGGGGVSDTDIFNLLTRLLLSKVHDEQTTSSDEKYQFQICNGENLEQDTLPRLNKLYRESLQSRLRVSDSDVAQMSIREARKGTDAQIRYAIERLAPWDFTEMAKEIDGDLLGAFYEGILRSGFKQSKGQFFTHPNIVRFMIRAVGLRELTKDCILGSTDLPLILDPSAGSGTFLIESMKAIAAEVSKISENIKRTNRNLTGIAEQTMSKILASPVRKNYWAKDHIFGLEINGDLGLAAQVNMLLHSDGASSVLAGSRHGNALAAFSAYPSDAPMFSQSRSIKGYKKRVNEQFDVILTNPPFSAKYSDEEREEFGRALSIVESSKRSEDYFVERWFQFLKPGGRLAAVVPNSLLDSRTQTAGRDFISKWFFWRAIISLPADAFAPYTMTKTSVILCQKKHEPFDNQPNSAPKFISVASPGYLGYTRSAKKEELTQQNDLNAIAEELEKKDIWR